MENIFIKNYKCLESLEVSGLKRVNLFTGKNNTGKSTVLEALSLLASKGNIEWIYHLLETRGEITHSYRGQENISEDLNIKILSALFINRNTIFSEENTITIKSDEEEVSLSFVKYIEEEIYEKNQEGEKRSIGKKTRIIKESSIDNFSLGFGIKANEYFNIIPLDRDLLRMLRRYITRVPNNNFHLINARGDDIFDIAHLWDKVTLSEKDGLVIDALKIIEPRITRLSFIGEKRSYRNERYPIVKIEGIDKPYPLKAMGDGVNKILSFILALVNSDNGYLLIDEFENGLHHSVQEKLWEVIFKISNQLNIQVFVTTHSNDSINSFAKVLSKSEEFEGSLHRLFRISNDKIKSNAFTEEEIKEASLQNINLR